MTNMNRRRRELDSSGDEEQPEPEEKTPRKEGRRRRRRRTTTTLMVMTRTLRRMNPKPLAKGNLHAQVVHQKILLVTNPGLCGKGFPHQDPLRKQRQVWQNPCRRAALRLRKECSLEVSCCAFECAHVFFT